MNKKEIKYANRRALPAFLILLVISSVMGYIGGYFSASFRLDMLADGIKDAGAFFGLHIAPWIIVALAVILPAVCVPLYWNTKKLLNVWDGEDESISSEVDRKLSAAIWASSVTLVFTYFLIAATYSGGFTMFDSKEHTIIVFVGIAAFFVVMAETVILQQKCVDTVKQINPEKKASIYDIRFQKKWLEDCDEAEKIMIGKCAYKAYATTNTVCTVLAVALAVCALVLDIGFFPSFVVCLVWIVNLSAYCKESIRYSKAGNKIS